MIHHIDFAPFSSDSLEQSVLVVGFGNPKIVFHDLDEKKSHQNNS